MVPDSRVDAREERASAGPESGFDLVHSPIGLVSIWPGSREQLPKQQLSQSVRFNSPWFSVLWWEGAHPSSSPPRNT